jgi:hypothetical protein
MKSASASTSPTPSIKSTSPCPFAEPGTRKRDWQIFSNWRGESVPVFIFRQLHKTPLEFLLPGTILSRQQPNVSTRSGLESNPSLNVKIISGQTRNITGSFCARAAAVAEKLSSFFRQAQLSAWLTRRLSKPPALLAIESLVAVSLAVYFFFLMLPQVIAPRSYDGNPMNAYLFTYLSAHPYSQTDMISDFDNWRARLAGPMITGWLHDASLKEVSISGQNEVDAIKYFGGYGFNVLMIDFGFYHAVWLFLLFVVLILHRKDALLIILGVFSGLMYNVTIPSGAWFFPWDMPTLFFFTWACLLYDRGQFFPLLLVVWLGSLFKETTLCCALLVLLGGNWSLKKRIAGFAALAIACLLTRRLLMTICGVKTMFFALNNAGNFHELAHKTWRVFSGNIHTLFSANLNHVLFVNAGALFVMMLIPWRNRRDVVFKLLAAVFIIGQFLCGSISEFRIWYELLPLGWMVISETLATHFSLGTASLIGPGLSSSDPVADNQASRVMKCSYWLIIFLVLVALALARLTMKY